MLLMLGDVHTTPADHEQDWKLLVSEEKRLLVVVLVALQDKADMNQSQRKSLPLCWYHMAVSHAVALNA